MGYHDIVSALPIAFSFHALVGPFTPRQRLFLFIGFLTGSNLSRGIKDLTNEIPWIKDLTRRPSGVSTCDLLSQKSLGADSPGMPSGHMTVTTFFLLTITRYEMTRKGLSFRELCKQDPFFVLVNVCIFIAMALARTQKECHTWLQVYAGTALGAFVFYLTKFVEKKSTCKTIG
jgi:membrane-associated phospholipid phosphatase